MLAFTLAPHSPYPLGHVHPTSTYLRVLSEVPPQQMDARTLVWCKERGHTGAFGGNTSMDVMFDVQVDVHFDTGL